MRMTVTTTTTKSSQNSSSISRNNGSKKETKIVTSINNDDTTTTRHQQQITITDFFLDKRSGNLTFLRTFSLCNFMFSFLFLQTFFKDFFSSLQFHIFIFFCIANPDLCASHLWIPKKQIPLLQFTIKVSLPWYMSLEVVLGECYNKTADVYALGCLFLR